MRAVSGASGTGRMRLAMWAGWEEERLQPMSWGMARGFNVLLIPYWSAHDTHYHDDSRLVYSPDFLPHSRGAFVYTID